MLNIRNWRKEYGYLEVAIKIPFKDLKIVIDILILILWKTVLTLLFMKEKIS